MMIKSSLSLVLAFVLVIGTACESTAADGKVSSPGSVDELLATVSKYKLTLIELGSVNCRPCKMMTPVLESVAKTYAGRVQVAFFDVWKDQGPARHYAIRVIPVQVFLDAAGKEVFRHEGYFGEEALKAALEELLKKAG